MERFKKYKLIIIILASFLVIESSLLIISWIHKPKKAPLKPLAHLAIKGKIAIVIDDWGYNLINLNTLEQIKEPLTLSILPNLPYSKYMAKEAHKRGFEVILHLPMEPSEKYRLEKNTIMCSMGEQEIAGILRQDLSSIIYARGISNHMGSCATRDIRVMSIILNELKKERLYFLDSFVSASGVPLDLAHKMHVGFARRDVFIDNKKDPEYMLGQLARLKFLARTHGQAIGITHDREASMKLLKEAIPELIKEGYKLVFVSDLLR